MNLQTDYRDDIEIDAPADRHAKDFTLFEALAVITQSWRLITGIVLLATLVGAGHVLISQPVYRADALLHVDKDSFGIGSLGDFSDLATLFYGLEVNAEARVLSSRSILGPVVDKRNLTIKAQPMRLPVVGAAVASFGIADNKLADLWRDLENPWLRLDDYGWGDEYIDVRHFSVPPALIGEPFTLITGEKGRYQLRDAEHEISMEGRVGKLAELRLRGDNGRISLLVSVLQATSGTHFEIVKEPRLQAIESLGERLLIEAEVEETNTGESAASGLLSVSLDGSDPRMISTVLKDIVSTYLSLNLRRKFENANQALALLEEQLSTVKKEMKETEGALNQYRLEQGSIDLGRETSNILNKIVGVESRLSEVKTNRMQLLQKFTPQHTRVSLLDSQIAALERELGGLESGVRTLPETQQKILNLSREAKVDRHFYDLLSNKVQELKVVRAGTVGNASVIDPVATPFEPMRPRAAFMMSLYVLLGGLLGVGGAFGRKALRGVIDNPDEIEQQLGLPVYAVVPDSPAQKKCAKGDGRKGVKRTVLAARDPQDIAIESLRSLRTWMNFALLDARNNVLLVTGPAPGVGKSFVSVNLGAVWASAGKKVLIIDADLRQGHLHRYFGRERDGGLSNVIAGDIRVSQAIHQTQIDGLSIITGGTILPNPSELLMHENFATILEDCSSRFDHVIIDSPPVLAVTDAAILGRLAAAALLVLKANTHPLPEIKQSVKRLRHAGVHLRGVVFNRMNTSKRYGYGKYYGSAYGYSYKSSKA